jgi:DNA-binding transcriptional ArsR family regulator
VPGGQLAFGDWEEAVRAVTDLQRNVRPALVVLDEFPYLLTHSPELPSVLQRAIDRSRDGGPPVRLVLCGSALSIMARLLTGAQALRGRASHDVMVSAFDYRTAAQFWGIPAASVAFLVHAVIGGTPGYRDLLPAKPPSRSGDLARWLAAGPLNPASALFREDDYLLTEERPLADRTLYHAVVAAIAHGNTSQGAVAAALGREQRAVQYPLKALEEAGFVNRHDDVLRARRPIYRVADPIIRFHHVVTRRDLARFEDRRTAEAWPEAQPRFATHVLGPHFEDLTREFTFRFADPATVGGHAAIVGPAVVNDAKARIQHQLDVVAVGRDHRGTTPVLAIGEAKHTTKRRTLADVHRLERVRQLLDEKGVAARDAKLLLFSVSGFDRIFSPPPPIVPTWNWSISSASTTAREARR